jgi:FAD:protein FMN transferase
MIIENQTAAEKTLYAMGTIMVHKAFGLRAEESLEAVGREVSHIERILSRFLPRSEINRINESAGISSQKISFDTYEVLSKSVEFSQMCPGCFDITVEPLVTLWNSVTETVGPPDEISIQQVLPLVNYRDLILEPWQMSAGLCYSGQSIDLGGIGKGFAGDRIIEVLKEHDIPSAYANLGGNVVTLGTKPDGSLWNIGIQHPRQKNRLIGSVSVADQTVVTSGDYQRYVTDKSGMRHHHILDPTTGCPADSGLISVSIVSNKSVVADALSTILFVAGMEKGLRFLKLFPHTEAIFVETDMQVTITHGLRSCFQADKGIRVTILDG